MPARSIGARDFAFAHPNASVRAVRNLPARCTAAHFTVTLSGASGADITNATGTGTVIDGI
jgi:hypothetical protein